MQHRPLIGNANVLPIGCPVRETVSRTEHTNTIQTNVLTWLASNPTKRPQYWILFPDIPSRINATTSGTNYEQYYFSSPADNSVSYELHSTVWPGPFVNHINMNTTNDCKAYIDKLEFFATNNQTAKRIISASVGLYSNRNDVMDNVRYGAGTTDNRESTGWYLEGQGDALVSMGISSNSIVYADGTDVLAGTNLVTGPHIYNATNVAAYVSWGAHSSLGAAYAVNGSLHWTGDSRWWVVARSSHITANDRIPAKATSFSGLRVTLLEEAATWQRLSVPCRIPMNPDS